MVDYAWSKISKEMKCKMCAKQFISTNRMQIYCKECALIRKEESRKKANATRAERRKRNEI